MEVVCRFCGTIMNSSLSIGLYEGKPINAWTKLTIIQPSLQVSACDGLPQCICENCNMKLNFCYDFMSDVQKMSMYFWKKQLQYWVWSDQMNKYHLAPQHNTVLWNSGGQNLQYVRAQQSNVSHPYPYPIPNVVGNCTMNQELPVSGRPEYQYTAPVNNQMPIFPPKQELHHPTVVRQNDRHPIPGAPMRNVRIIPGREKFSFNSNDRKCFNQSAPCHATPLMKTRAPEAQQSWSSAVPAPGCSRWQNIAEVTLIKGSTDTYNGNPQHPTNDDDDLCIILDTKEIRRKKVMAMIQKGEELTLGLFFNSREKGYSCVFCNFVSQKKTKLVRHIAKHHELNKQLAACRKCGKKFINKTVLSVHKKFKCRSK